MQFFGKHWVQTFLVIFFALGCYLEVAAGAMVPTVALPLRLLKVVFLGGVPMALLFTGTIWMSRYCLENHREGIALKTAEILGLIALIVLSLGLLAFFFVAIIVRNIAI